MFICFLIIKMYKQRIFNNAHIYFKRIIEETSSDLNQLSEIISYLMLEWT
jgi:hypothetical protein